MEAKPKPQPLSKPESGFMDSPQPAPSSPATTPTQHQVRLANPSDAQWLIDLTNHVQSALTSSGSLQELTPSTLETILAAIAKQEIYLLISTLSSPSLNHASLTSSSSECNPVSESRIGSVTISPFSPIDGRGSSAWPISIPSSKTTEHANPNPNHNTHSHSKTWYLTSLMLNPSHQGHGLGKRFLRDVFQLLGTGMVVLDCWAGNEKLRSFYEDVGCTLVGAFPEREYEVAVFEVE
ncbi:hypothetical protein IFR05_005323, partial [Cadophora sp. M221]